MKLIIAPHVLIDEHARDSTFPDGIWRSNLSASTTRKTKDAETASE
jgi:hypothetical protein